MSPGEVFGAVMAAWAGAAIGAWAFIRGSRKKPPAEPLPPGYGERYRYRSHFDELEFTPEEMQPDILLPMPEDLWDEPTNTLMAFKRLTACKVCGFHARVCSSAACPQRKELS